MPAVGQWVREVRSAPATSPGERVDARVERVGKGVVRDPATGEKVFYGEYHWGIGWNRSRSGKDVRDLTPGHQADQLCRRRLPFRPRGIGQGYGES